MKTYSVGLQKSITSSYDKTKTTILGRVAQKTFPAPFNSSPVLGAPLSKFIDVQTDTTPVVAVTVGMMAMTANGRLFCLGSAPSTGAINNIVLYNFDPVTGAKSYVGKILFAISAPTTITTTAFKVDDTNPNNIKIFHSYRSTTAIMGGIHFINKVTLASFTPTGTIYYAAQANDVAGVYSLQMPLEVGSLHTLTTVSALIAPATGSSNPLINTKLYAHNGTSATHQYYQFDYATAPQMAPINAFTASAISANPLFTSTAPHGLVANDAVIMTGGAPTAYANSLVNTVQTIYYVIAAGLTATQFELSATLGGVALNPTSTTSGITFARANGQCSNLGIGKTANLPALGAGTLLLTNSENYCIPSSSINAGSECAFCATTTNFYLGKLSELFTTLTGTLNATTLVTGLSSTAGLTLGMSVVGTGIPLGATISIINSSTSITLSAAATVSSAQSLVFGATAWPSLTTVNVLGNGLDYVLPAPLQAFYGESTDKVFYLVAGSILLAKQWVNSAILANLGNTSNGYMEAQNHITDPLQLAAVNSVENYNGWVFFSSSATIGQRGIIAMDVRSDYNFDYSSIISPVISTPGGMILHSIQTIEQMFDYTGGGVFYYRTAATSGDAMFSSASGGWTLIPTAQPLDLLLNNYTQFKAMAVMTAAPGSANVQVTTPFQVIDLEYTAHLLAEISDYWDYSYADSSTAIPTRIGFALRTAYGTGTVPKLTLKAYDTSGNLLVTADTVANAGNFQYSTDAGLTWLPLGTIANVADTRLRFTFTTPPGVNVRVGLE
jgi:hypothetical protein